MKKIKLIHSICLILILSVMSPPAYAVQPDEILSDPLLEQRARLIGQELRCLVCQNQSIDDSDADLAHDLRVLLRQRLQAGDTDAQVKNYIVARYGDYVLLQPPFKATTWALWLGPPFFTLCGILLWLASCRRRDINIDNKKLTAVEQARLESILNNRTDIL